jgi:hypothetical protein
MRKNKIDRKMTIEPLTKQQLHDLTCENRKHDSYCDHELTEYNKGWFELRLRRLEK